ncbi:MAG: glutamate--tRNA ligase [Rickettsiales bacterium]|nr:glutamate--tRNA ligase [Rickettsiales bacterium]
MTKICRFAPSPTGFLHVGNIRAAIINYLYAKNTNGKFLLRFDDTDASRVKDEYKNMILEDLKWLGIHYDQMTKQSDFLKRYEEAKNQLIKSGHLYECFETPEELKLQRKSQTAAGMRPIYDRSALNLTNEQKDNLRQKGIKSYFRFKLKDEETSWEDKIKGKITYPGRHFSDPVVIRENNIPTYTFCSVIDDIDFKITDIIRGEDHITNTAIQIQIFESLGVKAPNFAHLGLIKAREGKISKREGGYDIKTLRQEGFEPMSIINLLSQIGTSKPIEIHKNIDSLAKEFDFNIFSKSSTNYEIQELNNLNQKLLISTHFEEIKNRLPNIEEQYAKKLWQCISPNITFFKEIFDWLQICTQETVFATNPEDKDFLKEISHFLPQDTKDENCWENWIGEIKKISNRKGKQLFMPIRVALTGQNHGPELRYLINLLERDLIIKRLGS